MIKTLTKSMRQYGKTSILTMILSVAEVVFEILIPLCMSDLIDYGITGGNMSAVWKYGIAILILSILEFFVGKTAATSAAKAATGFCANLREDMYRNVQTLAFSNIDKFSTASIVTRLTTDVTNVQNAYQMLIRMAIRGPVMLIICVCVCFSINVKISLIFLVVIPILAVILLLIVMNVSKIFKKVFKTYDKLNNTVEENVRGIRVVKTFNQEEGQTSKFKKISQDIYNGYCRGEKLIALNSPAMQACMYTCTLLICWIGAQAIVASGNDPAAGLTTGNLTALLTYAIQIMMALMMLSMVFAMITIARSSAERIAELLEETTDIANPENPVKEVKNGEIIFDHVNFMYATSQDADGNEEADSGGRTERKKVLTDINLHIRSGQTVGIIGATGSSKSSLVQLIPRLYDVTDGTLKLGGVDVRKYDLMVLRDSVSVVLQKNELFSGTIKDNLRWGNENATDEEIVQACREAQADEFVNQMPDGYDTWIEQGGTNVSGGQKQRLCIARALLKKPKVLILDDSTSAVDTKTDALIQKAFAEDIPDTTKIIIAQRISSVQNADQIIVMDDGRISAVGTHDELLKTSSIYREVYESQQKGGDDNE
jgi:ATP-binding cassette subfamily B protein